jgi:ubiquinone/menaquinone biosynthesis C-methylase UbiE
MSTDKVLTSRQQAIERHNIDSGIFQGRYMDFSRGRFTDEFIYGRYQVFEEVEKELKILQPGSRVLDLGCGTGHFSKYIFSKGFEVHAIDPSLKMLDFAKQNFPEINFLEGIASSIPFPDNFFDLIISIEVLRYLDTEDVKRAYAEMHRVLKPGGRILITHVNTFASDGYYFFYHIKQTILKLFRKPLHACYFTTPDREVQLAKEAGFSSAVSTGRMFGSIRIAYKFGKLAGRSYARFLEVFSRNQNFDSGLSRSLAGHLILTASK